MNAELLVEAPPLPRIARAHNYRWLVVGTVCIGAFLGQLDASIASLVLPTLEDVFRASVASVEWVAIAYLLTLAALVVTFGRLADMLGRKTMYTAGFLVFICGSALCGLAPGLGWLIVFRVVQAVGAAMLQANSVAIITAAVPHDQLGRAIGVQGAAQAIGLSVGPSLGGLLISAFGWQWVFFIAVPFGLAGALLGWLILPRSAPASDAQKEAARERFDWGGASVFAAAIAALLLALTYGNSWGWTSPRLLSALAAFVLALAGFALLERRAPSPLIEMALFRRGAFSAGISAGLLSYSVLFGLLFLMPFYLERILGRTAAVAGLLLTPVPLAIGLLAPASGLLADKRGARRPMMAGMFVAAIALAGLALVSPAPLGAVLGLLAAFGVGLGLFTPPNNSAIMGSAPPNRLGVAGGVLNMTRSVGTSFGVAATGAVLAVRLAGLSGGTVESTFNASQAALLGAFRDSLLFLAALAVVALAISAARGRAHRRVVIPTEL
ncbi:MAG: MFS transporter [Chloroflexi bacterium]|nr:MFS transporter [Chloroflexota bacterium]